MADGLDAALELWVAAGLLRLAHGPQLERLGATAGIIAVRHLVAFGLSPPHSTDEAPPDEVHARIVRP